MNTGGGNKQKTQIEVPIWPNENSKIYWKNLYKKQKSSKIANWFLHLDNLNSELAFNICWNALITKFPWL